jgi:hypothetical protein
MRLTCDAISAAQRTVSLRTAQQIIQLGLIMNFEGCTRNLCYPNSRYFPQFSRGYGGQL